MNRAVCHMWLFLVLALLLPRSGLAMARDIDLSELGHLLLEFSPLQAQETVPGEAVWAEVKPRPAETYVVYAPRRVHQVFYRAMQGQEVGAGDAIALLRGPEIHHWQVEYSLLQEQYRMAEARYRRNLPLYQSNAMPESQWLAILERWQSLQLEFEHMRHFAELVGPAEDEDSFSLLAPIAGRISYTPSTDGIAEGEPVAVFIPQGTVRVRTMIPAARREALQELDIGVCSVGIEAVGALVHAGLVEVWTLPLPTDCALLPGESLAAKPLYSVHDGSGHVYRVPSSALLVWQEQAYLLVRHSDTLRMQAVQSLADTGDAYLVLSTEALDGREVLSTSVSAVQGILLGLGGE